MAWQILSFAFWKFLEFFFWIFLIHSWLNKRMQNQWIWQADCTFFYVILLIFLFFKCRIIALQCCISFCQTTWISHNFIYIYIYINPLSQKPPYPFPSHPSRSSQSARLGLPVLYRSFPLITSFTHDSVYICQYYFLN